MTIKEIIKKLNTTIADHRGHESHFESWMTLIDGICDAIDALKALDKQEPLAWMSEDEREAFERFNETCEDGEGYDVPKTMMKRLAEIGVIHHTSRGIYGITKFGRFLVGKTTPPQRKPLPYEQLDSLWQTTDTGDFELDIREFARAIESAHGIKDKNTGEKE